MRHAPSEAQRIRHRDAAAKRSGCRFTAPSSGREGHHRTLTRKKASVTLLTIRPVDQHDVHCARERTDVSSAEMSEPEPLAPPVSDDELPPPAATRRPVMGREGGRERGNRGGRMGESQSTKLLH